MDLSAHRARVADAIGRMGDFAVVMEQFGARGRGDATKVSLESLRTCAIYVGIVAWRYGTVPKGKTRSVTHLEYEEAQRLHIPSLIFLADPKTEKHLGPYALFPETKRNTTHSTQLLAFRQELQQDRVVDFFTTPDDLAAKVVASLSTYLQEQSHQMSLSEIVILEIGPAIAKAIFQAWTTHTSTDSNTAFSIDDPIGSRIEGRISQQKMRRQFEGIGERIGESLLPVFRSGDVSLDEDSRKSVAWAAAEAFRRFPMSQIVQNKRGLDPQKISQQVQEADIGKYGLASKEEVLLYNRAVSECSAYIVDIASQLPTYGDELIAWMHKRGEEQLLTIAINVLHSLQRIREQLNPMQEAERFELEYRQAVSRNLDVLELFGTDFSMANKRHRLSVAYVTLSVHHRMVNDTRWQRRGAPNEAWRRNSSSDFTLTTVDRALASSQRLLIRGLAGSGKTTLLQWIAVRSASRTFTDQLAS